MIDRRPRSVGHAALRRAVQVFEGAGGEAVADGAPLRLTAIGYIRSGIMTVYTHRRRVIGAPAA